MINDVPLFGLLKAKMRWHEARQKLLAENVANSNTPSYRAKELKPLAFEPLNSAHRSAPAAAARTDPAHFKTASLRTEDGFAEDNAPDFEVTPAGNGVVLEEEMMKVAANQFDYQLASSLYSRSLGLIRAAIGRSV